MSDVNSASDVPASAVSDKVGNAKSKKGEFTKEKKVLPKIEKVADPEKALRELKKVPSPSIEDRDREIEVQKAKIESLQARVNAIKSKLEARNDNKTGTRAEETAILEELKKIQAARRDILKARSVLKEKVDSAQNNQKDLNNKVSAAKKKLGKYSTHVSIDEQIARLEFEMSTSSMSIQEEKTVMLDIKSLKLMRGTIREVERLEAMRDTEGTKPLLDAMKAKSAELDELKSKEEPLQEKLNELREKNKSERTDIPALQKERDELRNQINDLYENVRKINKEYKEREDEHWANKRYVNAYKQQIWEMKKEADAEYRKQKEAERANEVPEVEWEITERIYLIEQLITYLDRLSPKEEKEEEEVACESKTSDIAGFSARRKGDNDDEKLASEGLFFSGVQKAKGKKKLNVKRENKKQTAKSDAQLKLSAQVFSDFKTAEVEAPLSASMVGKAIEDLKQKLTIFKNLPPGTKLNDLKPKPAKVEKKEKDSKKESDEEEIKSGSVEDKKEESTEAVHTEAKAEVSDEGVTIILSVA